MSTKTTEVEEEDRHTFWALQSCCEHTCVGLT